MSFSQLRSCSSLLSSSFPTLTFNGLKVTNDKNTGICDKIILKHNVFSFCGFTVRLADYSFDGAEMKIAIGSGQCSEMSIQNGKLKVQILSNDENKANSEQAKKSDFNVDITFSNLEFEFCKDDELLFTLTSKEASIKLRQNVSLEASFPSCGINYQGTQLIKDSRIQLLFDNKMSTISCISEDILMSVPLQNVHSILTSFKNFLQNLTVNFSFEKFDVYMNADTRLTFDGFVFTYNQGKYNIRANSCVLNLSSYNFLLKTFKVANGKLTIQNFDVKNSNNNFMISYPQKNEPVITGILENEDSMIKINISSIDVDISLLKLKDLIASISSNSAIKHVLSLGSEKQFTLDMSNITLNIKIDQLFTLSVHSNYGFSLHSDITVFSITDMSYKFNKNPLIVTSQVFQFIKKFNEGRHSTNILLSPLVFNFSVNEISPFLTFLKSISMNIKNLFLAGNNEITIDMQEFQLFIGQTVEGTRDRTKFLHIKVDNPPLSIACAKKEFAFDTRSVISVKAYNTLTSFWDTIVEPFPLKIDVVLSENKKHITSSVETQISFNISSDFLNKLIFILSNPSAKAMPLAFVSNYTDSKIIISESRGCKMTISPMSTIPFIEPFLYYSYEEEPPGKISFDAITSKTFLKNNIFLDIEIKENIKHIFFMHILSIENKLGFEIQVFSKVKKSVSLLFSLKNKERHGLPNTLNFEGNFIVVANGAHVDNNNTFAPKKYKAINYTLKGTNYDSDILVYLTKNPVNKVKILNLLPRYEFENRLPIPISCTVKHCKTEAAFSFKKHEAKPLNMPFDINQPFELTIAFGDKEMSKPLLIPLKEISKVSEFVIYFDKFQFRVNVCLSPLQSYKFIIYIPTVIYNCSSMSFLVNSQLVQKAKNYSLPIFNHKGYPAIFINDYDTPEVEIPATSHSAKLPITTTLFSEKHDIFLQMKSNENLLTPLRAFLKKKIGMTNRLFLYDMIIIKNHTKKTIAVILDDSMKLQFDPGLTAPISIINNMYSYQLEISGYDRVERVYLTYVTNTVLRFANIREDYLLQMIITENKNGQFIVEFKEPSISTAPYLMVNNTEFEMYVQQTEKYLPKLIQPFTSTIFGFDDPFSMPLVVITIEGKSTTALFSKDVFNAVFPYKVAGKRLKKRVKTLNGKQRAIIIHSVKGYQISDYSINIEIPQAIMTLLNTNSVQLCTVYASKTTFEAKTDGHDISANFQIMGIQAEDETDSLAQGILLSSVSEPVPFFSFNAYFGQKIDSSHLLSLSVKFNRIDIQFSSAFALNFTKFYLDSSLKKISLKKTVFDNKPIFASSIQISPINACIFLRKDPNEQVSESSELLSKMVIPSLLNCNLPSILMNNVSGPFDAVHNFISRVYNNSIRRFVAESTGQPFSFEERISYPRSLSSIVSLSIDDPNYNIEHKNTIDHPEVVQEMDHFPQIEEKVLIVIDDKNALISRGSNANAIKEFQLIKEESVVNTTYLQRAPKKIGYRKSFFLNRIENADTYMFVYGEAMAALKKKKLSTLFYFHPLIARSQYAFVFDDSFDVVDLTSSLAASSVYAQAISATAALTSQNAFNSPGISTAQGGNTGGFGIGIGGGGNSGSGVVIASVPLALINEVVVENTELKVTIAPEKPKLPPKMAVFKFESPLVAETMMNEIISHKEQLSNK